MSSQSSKVSSQKVDSQKRLSLSEYSSKYKVSISTLRRKIKNHELKASFVDGKYLLEDRSFENLDIRKKDNDHIEVNQTLAPPPQTQGLVKPKISQTRKAASAQDLGSHAVQVDTQSKNLDSQITQVSSQVSSQVGSQKEGLDSQAFVNMTNHLLAELKKAYSLVLQEKEEQLLHFKEEIADLKTLVRVLEEENTRLQARRHQAVELDGWLDALDKDF